MTSKINRKDNKFGRARMKYIIKFGMLLEVSDMIKVIIFET